LLSPVPDDDGFAELSDFNSDLEANHSMKSYVAEKEAANVPCRKRRRGTTDSSENDNLSHVSMASAHVSTSPACSVGCETPTSSKQAAKRVRECTDVISARSSGENQVAGRRLVRCHSEAVIHQALSTSDEHSNLVGDFSRPHSLPLLSCTKHQDLKSISSDTVRYTEC